jgi:putative ABC transport system permease protein
LDADILVLQENVELNLTTSRVDQDTLNAVRRINGVAGVGLLAFSNGTLVFPDGQEPLDVSLVGIDPGYLGSPALLAGVDLRHKYSDEVIIDDKTASKYQLSLGDKLTIKTIQGDEEEFYTLRIVGITDERQYFFAPTVILPMYTWEEIRPQSAAGVQAGQPIGNMVAVKAAPGIDPTVMQARMLSFVEGIEVADKETLIQAQPGYAPQQITVNTQRYFALFIGILVVGGFFQIQTLQKVAQIGMLKAIGTSDINVGTAALIQIVVVTVVGVLIGGLGVLAFSLGLPDSVPLRFTLPTVTTAIGSLLLIGPLGGLVSIRLALKVEPLTAIGLAS